MVLSLIMILFLSVSNITLLASIAVNRTVFNPEFLKNVLHSTNSYALVYNQIPSLISTFLPENMSKNTAGVARYLINNFSENGLKSESEKLIDSFYLYLNGSIREPSIDISLLKGEMESLGSGSFLKDILKKLTPDKSAVTSLPGNVKLNTSSSMQALSYFAQAYQLFSILPFVIASIMILFTAAIFIIAGNVWSALRRISASLLITGSILILVYFNQKSIVSSALSAIFSSSSGSDFKMLIISLHPALLFTFSSILVFILYWSLALLSAGILIMLAANEKVRCQLFDASERLSARMKGCEEKPSEASMSTIKSIRPEEEPQRGSYKLESIRNQLDL